MSTTFISMTFDLSANTTLVLPVTALTGTIDWGDGNVIVYNSLTSNPSNTYSNSATYTVNINNVTSLTNFTTTSSQSIYKSCLTSFSYLINIPSFTNLSQLFFGCVKNFSINFSPNVTSNVTDMSSMFAQTTLFNQPITLDCSSCTFLNSFLFNATSFNSTLNLTNTTNVTNMSGMLRQASAFNQPITLDCSSCTRLDTFLYLATSFNSTLNLTNTSKVENMLNMFREASAFNKPITLDCSSCTTLDTFLYLASSFNSPLNLTNTSRVQTMIGMFRQATALNQPITLDCSSCTKLQNFLLAATSFNSPLNLTNTSKVTNMSSMFNSASALNQPITLDCSSCTNLNAFLNGASSFNSALNLTPIPSLLDATNMIVNTNLSTTNYSNLLTLWGSQPSLKPNVTLTASGIKYNSSSQQYRTTLVSSNNWIIIDGGMLPLPTITNFSIPTKTYGDSPFSIVDPSSNSTGAFTYTSSNNLVADVSGNTITIIGTGTSVINAIQAATTNYSSGDASANFVVNKANPIIGTLTIPSEMYLDTSFSIVDPSSNSSGAFTYTSSDTSVARISGNTVQIVGIGSSTITATQEASGNYVSGNVSSNLISNICFPAGTPINTDQGIIAIEKINPEIHTIRNKKIIGITKTKSTNDFLVCLEKHALGNNIPSQKTLITRDHGIFYNGKMRRAVELIEFSENIYKVKYNGEVLYNVLMEQHDKMVVNNLICETLNPSNPIAKLYNKIQNCTPEKQERLIKEYNEFIIKNNNFSKKQLSRVL
jgi:hypothetical protein